MNLLTGDTVAQLAHVGWGGFLTLALSRYLPSWEAALAVLLFAIGKEVIESVWGAWEPIQPWRSAAEDVAFWGLGIALALLVVY